MNSNLARGLASVAVCALGAYAMDMSNGTTGIGWSIFGLYIIWANAGSGNECDDE